VLDVIALVTANFGNHASLKALPPTPGIDGFYYTDKAIPTTIGWKVIQPDYPWTSFHPRLRAKYFKAQIHRLAEVQGYDWLVWADSSITFKSTQFIADACRRLEQEMDPNRWAGFYPHPERNTPSQEYAFVKSQIEHGNIWLTARYADDNMKGQMEFLSKAGANDDKLWCGGLWIVANIPQYHDFLNDWWDQIVRYSIMDQLSLPYCLDRHRIRPDSLGPNIYASPDFTIGHSWGR